MFKLCDLLAEGTYYKPSSKKSKGKGKSTPKDESANYILFSPSLLEGCVFVLSERPYINYPERKRLRINDRNGNPLLIVCPDLPDKIRNSLIPLLKLASPGRLQYTDSQALGNDYRFTACHYTWWNRYATNVSVLVCNL